MDYRLISTELNKHQLLKERLLSEYPTLDEAALRDTLEGITDLHEMLAAVIRSALVDEALQVGLRRRLYDMKERLTRLELRDGPRAPIGGRGHERGGAQQTSRA